MNEPTNPTSELTDAEVLAWQQEQDTKRADARRKAKIDRARLAMKFTRELGPEGSAFVIHDTGDLGEGMIVVKLGDALRWQAYLDVEKPTDSDRHDLIADFVVHPSKEQFAAIVNKRKALYLELTNKLAGLYGLKVKADEGK